jgi:catechol 2,3-dioxygenase-like lactoylglutathione lyase family enzyme
MIQHVTRQTPPAALEQCIDFYRLLGFESVPVPPGIAGRALWLEHLGTQIHLMPQADARPASGHVGVVVEGYDEAVARRREGGHEVEARREHWGSPRSYVHDPAGNLVELMAFAPGAGRAATADSHRST